MYQRGIKTERQPFVVVGVWSCGFVRALPNKFSVISPFSSSRATALLLYVFRVPCLTTILDSWSSQCETTYTTIFIISEKYGRSIRIRGDCFPNTRDQEMKLVLQDQPQFHQLHPHETQILQNLDVLFNEILLPTTLDRCVLHLGRNLIATFLLAACNAAVHLVHPDADPFHSQEIAQH